METARPFHPLGEKKSIDNAMFDPLQFQRIITLEPGTMNLELFAIRRGGRAAEGPALEKQYPVKNGIVGSNPTLSAT
jgi:hypothetical protein